jgi:hypothetical protein
VAAPIGDHLAPRGRGRRDAGAEEAERGLHDDDEADVQREQDHERVHDVRDDVDQHDPQLEQPCTRASDTKSRALTPRTSPRTTRANRAQMMTVIAITMVLSPAPRLTARSSAIRIVGT